MDLLNKEHSKKEHSPLIFRHMTVSGTVIAKKKTFFGCSHVKKACPHVNRSLSRHKVNLKSARWLCLHLPVVAWDATRRASSSRSITFMAWAGIGGVTPRLLRARDAVRGRKGPVYKALVNAICRDLAIE